MLFILHQTNCQNAFGAGFAGYLNRTFPPAQEGYHTYMEPFVEANNKASALGTTCEVQGDGFAVVHCFGQQFYGNSRKTGKCYTIYSKLESALAEFRKNHPNDTAICPLYMGCGLAGGDWNRVLDMCYRYNIIPCDRIDLEHRVYHPAYPFGPNSPESEDPFKYRVYIRASNAEWKLFDDVLDRLNAEAIADDVVENFQINDCPIVEARVIEKATCKCVYKASK